MESLLREARKTMASVILTSGRPWDRATRDPITAALFKAGHPDPSTFASTEGRTLFALDVLNRAGYGPSLRLLREPGKWPHLLPFIGRTDRHEDGPDAGHMIRLMGEWCGCQRNDMLTLTGRRGSGRYDVWRASTVWWQPESDAVSCGSGGPGSIIYLRPGALDWTGEYVEQVFTCWESTPCAGGAVTYRRRVPLWTWDGDERDFFYDD